MIPIYKTYISKASVEYAHEAISSTWISSIGKYIDLASEKLSDLCEVKYALLTNNGTSATHLVSKSLKRYNPNIKRVLVPSSCYVAAYNSLIYDNNDWEIHCVDLDLDTWNMNVEDVRPDDAIFAVHNLGNIINVPELIERTGCVIIEDNCEGMFGQYSGAPAGSKSYCSSLSFFGNKNITCGEGGALLTNNEEVYKFSKKVLGQGQTDKRYIHDEVGYNYRMTNIQAAILLGQLEDADRIIENKKRVFNRYRENLSNTGGISLQICEENTTHSNWMFGVRLHGSQGYEQAREHFYELGVETRPMFYPYTMHKHLKFQGKTNISDLLNKEVAIFPSYPDLSNREIDYICESIMGFQNKGRRKKYEDYKI